MKEYAQIERIALALGEDLNNWCRNIIVSEAREGSGSVQPKAVPYEIPAYGDLLVKQSWLLVNPEPSRASETIIFLHQLFRSSPRANAIRSICAYSSFRHAEGE